MKDLIGTVVKLVVVLVGVALALYGAYCLYKKFIAKPKTKEFADTLDYETDFVYVEEDSIADRIRSAKDKISNVLSD